MNIAEFLEQDPALATPREFQDALLGLGNKLDHELGLDTRPPTLSGQCQDRQRRVHILWSPMTVAILTSGFDYTNPDFCLLPRIESAGDLAHIRHAGTVVGVESVNPQNVSSAFHVLQDLVRMAVEPATFA